jgi:hypothetical protein
MTDKNRDGFAVAALRAIMHVRGAELMALAADPVEWPRACAEVARTAFQAADAMLDAANKPDGQGET